MFPSFASQGPGVMVGSPLCQAWTHIVIVEH